MIRPRWGWIVSGFLAGLLVCSLFAAAPAGSSPARVEPAAALDAPAVGAAVAAPRGPPSAAVLALQGFDADRTVFRITVYRNGSATWLFRYEKSLNESERADFRAFAEEFNTNETDLYTDFRRRAHALVSNGSTLVDRGMAAGNFHRSARIEGLDNDLAVVEMSFRWDGFARVVDDRVVVGDLFEGGLYVSADQRIVFQAGPDLRFAGVRPDTGTYSGDTLAGSDTVTWVGPQSFTDNRPHVEFVPAAASPTAAGPVGSDPGSLLPIGVLVVVVLLGLGAAVAYRSGALPTGGTVGTESGDDGNAGAGVVADDGAASTGISEADLVPDEQRVMNLLEANGGRMKQVAIVEETDWSKSKVSMLLSEMEEEGRISKLRVGRENIVSVAGEEPDAVGSPFDDDEE